MKLPAWVAKFTKVELSIIAVTLAVILVGGSTAVYMAVKSTASQPVSGQEPTSRAISHDHIEDDIDNNTKPETSNPLDNPDADDSESIDPDTATVEQQLIALAMEGNATIECNFSTPDGSGKAYIINQNKMRINFTGSAATGNLLKVDNKAYVWTEGQPTGMSIDTSSFSTDVIQRFSAFKPAKFTPGSDSITTCQRVSNLDEALFQVPEGVEYQDITHALH